MGRATEYMYLINVDRMPNGLNILVTHLNLRKEMRAILKARFKKKK